LEEMKTLLFVAMTASANAITVVGNADPTRFLDFQSSPTINPNFIFSDVDLSGVGWADNRTVTLVSPQHFVYANHYQRPVGTIVRFVAADGTVVERTIVRNVSPIPTRPNDPFSDLAVGVLSAPIHRSTGIVPQPYLNNPTTTPDRDWYSLPAQGNLIVFGKNQQAGTGTNIMPGNVSATNVGGQWVDGVFESVYMTRNNEWEGYYAHYLDLSTAPAGSAITRPGDSGAPTLAVVGDRAAIVSIHGSSSSFDGIQRMSGTHVPSPVAIASLNALMARSGYHMTEVHPAVGEVTVEVEPFPVVGRMGEPITLTMTLANIGGVPVNNLKVSFTVGVEASGQGWVNTSAPGVAEFSKGGLAIGETSALSHQIIFDQPGTYDFDMSVGYDEGETLNRSYQIQVLPEEGSVIMISMAVLLFVFRRKRIPLANQPAADNLPT
jgi:hypothetical protein